MLTPMDRVGRGLIIILLIVITVRIVNPDTSYTVNGQSYCSLWQHGIIDWNALEKRCSW